MNQRKFMTAAGVVTAGLLLSTSAIAAGAMLPKNAISPSKLRSLAQLAIHQGAAEQSADFALDTGDFQLLLVGNNAGNSSGDDDDDDNDGKSDKDDDDDDNDGKSDKDDDDDDNDGKSDKDDDDDDNDGSKDDEDTDDDNDDVNDKEDGDSGNCGHNGGGRPDRCGDDDYDDDGIENDDDSDDDNDGKSDKDDDDDDNDGKSDKDDDDDDNDGQKDDDDADDEDTDNDGKDDDRDDDDDNDGKNDSVDDDDDGDGIEDDQDFDDNDNDHDNDGIDNDDDDDDDNDGKSDKDDDDDDNDGKSDNDDGDDDNDGVKDDDDDEGHDDDGKGNDDDYDDDGKDNEDDDDDDNDGKSDKDDDDDDNDGKSDKDDDDDDNDGKSDKDDEDCDECRGNTGGPRMQLFIEDARYDGAGADDPETWAKLGTTEFNLWVVGNVGGRGLVGDGPDRAIRDVRFVASFDRALLLDGFMPSLTFTPTQDGNDHGFNDLTTPADVTQCADPADQPFNADAVPLPAHGMLTADRVAITYCLGDFTETATNLADFQPDGPYPFNDPGWFPDERKGLGQINKYSVMVAGLPIGAQVHFDVYGFTDCDDLAFAPFSHDARWEQVGDSSIPAPGTLATFLAGLLGLGWLTRFKRRRTAA